MRLVAVYWFDANSLQAWTAIKEVRTTHNMAPCVTVGMVVKEDRSEIVLAQTLGATTTGEDPDAVHHVLAIPMKCVTKVVELRKHISP